MARKLGKRSEKMFYLVVVIASWICLLTVLHTLLERMNSAASVDHETKREDRKDQEREKLKVKREENLQDEYFWGQEVKLNRKELQLSQVSRLLGPQMFISKRDVFFVRRRSTSTSSTWCRPTK